MQKTEAGYKTCTRGTERTEYYGKEEETIQKTQKKRAAWLHQETAAPAFFSEIAPNLLI